MKRKVKRKEEETTPMLSTSDTLVMDAYKEGCRKAAKQMLEARNALLVAYSSCGSAAMKTPKRFREYCESILNMKLDIETFMSMCR